MFSFTKDTRVEDDAAKMKSLLDFFDTRYKDLSFEDIRAALPRDFPDCDVSEDKTLYFTYAPYPDFDFTITANPVEHDAPIIVLQGTWKFAGLVLSSLAGGTWIDRSKTDGVDNLANAAKRLLAELKRHHTVKTPNRQ